MSENQNPQPWPQQPADKGGSFPQWGDDGGTTQPSGQSASTSGQVPPPYGQPYGQPSETFGQPAQAFGQQQGQPYGQPAQPYGQPGAFQNPAYQPQPYGTSAYPALAQQDGPAWGGLGLAALLTSVAATVIGLILAYVAAGNFSDVISSLPPEVLDGSGQLDPNTLDPALQGKATAAGFALLGMFVPSIIGLVGLIMGAIAIAKRRGRAAGIVAIIVAIAAPVMWFLVLVAFLGSQVGNLPR